MNSHTLFHVGSCGKQFTALAVHRLAQAGRIDLNRPVGDYVRGLPAAWEAVPVSHLLAHTSGLPDYLSVVTEMDRPQQRAAIVQAAGALQPDFAPGAAWAYCNTGYLILGWLVEDVSGASYAASIDAVLRQVGLPNARVDSAGDTISGRAEPYDWEAGRIVHAVRMESGVSGVGDGGVLLSAADIGPWRLALDREMLLSPESTAAAFSPATMTTGRMAPYGGGYHLSRTRGRVLHQHAGSNPGFKSFWMALPEEGVSVFVTTNYSGRNGIERPEMAVSALEAYLPGSTWLSLPSGRADARSRSLQRLLSRGAAAPDPAILAPEAVVLHAKGRLIAWPADTLAPIETWTVGKTEHVRYRLVSGSETSSIVAGWTEDDRLYWLSWT